MDDFVIIKNRSWLKFEVTRQQAEKMLKNWDIDHKDIFDISPKKWQIIAKTPGIEDKTNPQTDSTNKNINKK